MVSLAYRKVSALYKPRRAALFDRRARGEDVAPMCTAWRYARCAKVGFDPRSLIPPGFVATDGLAAAASLRQQEAETSQPADVDDGVLCLSLIPAVVDSSQACSVFT
jgi:hypothetical protein